MIASDATSENWNNNNNNNKTLIWNSYDFYHLTCFTVSYIYELNWGTNIHMKFSGRIALVTTRNLSLSFGPILVVLSGSQSFC